MFLHTSKPLSALAAALTLTGLAAAASPAVAGPREQANTLFNRLNGVPPSAATLDALTTKVTAGDVKGAALDAINDPAGMFYNLTLKDLVARWTNTDGSPRVDLNDYTATVIGMVRDDVPFNTLMSADVLYVGDPTKVPGIPAYSLSNNAHYQFLDTQGSDLHSVLIQQKQSAVTNGIPADATAGIITTRGFAEAYFKDGTNRRAASFTFQNFLCNNMNQLADTTRADLRVRRDVTRAPGGDSALYRNKCAGCHAGMDGMAGAFAYYDVIDGATADADQFVYNAGQVDTKFNRNSDQFPEGYVTTDDGWVNLWVAGQNADIGWHGADSGNGAKAWGTMLTDTDAFATCMATTAVTAMCLHAPTTPAEVAAVTSIAADFQKDYLMKNAFAEAAAVCSGE
jgi:hypothetical protein